MIRSVLYWLGRQHQRRLGVSTPYFDEVIRHAPGAVVPILGFLPATGYGSRMPVTALHMVRLGAAVSQDCGTCVEIGVQMASRDGVSPPLVEAAITGQGGRLDAGLAAALRFGERIARRQDAPGEREVIRAHFGNAGLVEASVAEAGSLTFPALQRGLGFSRACSVRDASYAEDRGDE